MDYTQPGFWMAIGIGGSLVGAASAGQQFLQKDSEMPLRYRAILRDFCFGAFLTAILYMLIPESFISMTDSMSSFFTSLGSFQAKDMQSGGGEIELQIGPARF